MPAPTRLFLSAQGTTPASEQQHRQAPNNDTFNEDRIGIQGHHRRCSEIEIARPGRRQVKVGVADPEEQLKVAACAAVVSGDWGSCSE